MQELWNDEQRWDYTHGVLSMETIAPLYDYIGIPFQHKAAPPFQKLLRAYVREVFLSPVPGTVQSLAHKQAHLLQSIDSSYNTVWREEYVSWLIYVWVYRPGDHAAGWSSWKTIFMRCSVRSGGWPRLRLPSPQDALIRQELEDCKIRMDEARELVNEGKGRPTSEWDERVMDWLRIDDESKAAGEPYSRILLTATFFTFYLFWLQLIKILSPAELDALWESAKAIAPEVRVRVEDLPHPARLQLIPS